MRYTCESIAGYLHPLRNSEHILPVDRDVAHIWGEITARAQQSGHALGACDCLIAATALANGLHIMTRNVRDFECTGACLINPWPEA